MSDVPRLGPGRHHDGGGLYLVVGKGGARSWIFRFRRDGQLHDYGLGPVRTIGLADARERALKCRVALLDGQNRVATRQAQRLERMLAAAKAMLFEKAAEQCITAQAPGWRDPRQAAQWRQSLADHAYPTLGKLAVMEIDTPLVLKVLEPIWLTKTETATRVRARIEAVLDWSTSRGYRQGENPARWKGHLQNLLPARRKVRAIKHHPALPYSDVGAFMEALRAQEGIPARALEFLILTASRTGEVLGAKWPELDLAERVWVVPPERMKAGKEHRVPLSDAAMQVLEAMAALRVDEYVFPGRSGPIGGMAMRRVLEGLRPDVSVHGFRSTFSDWAHEIATGHSNEVIEMALAHTIKKQSEAAYRRGDLLDKRRALMRDWAQRCAGGAVVVPLPVRMEA